MRQKAKGPGSARKDLSDGILRRATAKGVVKGMSDQTRSIRFNDGAIYERYMGQWSRLAGDEFLDWLAPQNGQRWLDVGCGNGAFTEMLFDRCAPASPAGF